MYVCMCARACKCVRQVCVCVRVCCMCVCARARVCRARHRGLRSPSAATEAVVVYRDRGGGGSVVCVCVCARVCLSATALRDRAVASAVPARVCVCVRARASGTSPRVVTALRERLSTCQQLNMYYTSSQGSAVLLWEHNRNLGGSHRSHSPNNKVSLLRVRCLCGTCASDGKKKRWPSACTSIS